MEINSFSWTVSGNCAYKEIDKSTKDYNSTEIPKAICEYWNADTLSEGEKIFIKFIVKGKEYSATIEKRAGRVRLLWNDDFKSAIGINRISLRLQEKISELVKCGNGILIKYALNFNVVLVF
ncbi:hypothetical protein [Lacrimispora xylanisolvens]|uniref:hypothetical protein n=1 Tax=Lacrimispora xylanisolvens TaxID=384636 RepID=UPI002402C57F